MAPLALAAAALSAGELLRMFRQKGLRPSSFAVYAAAVLPVFGACLPVVWPGGSAVCPISGLDGAAIGLAACAAVALGAEMRRFAGPGTAIADAALVALSGLYVGGCLAVLVGLRLLGENAGLLAGWPRLLPLLYC